MTSRPAVQFKINFGLPTNLSHTPSARMCIDLSVRRSKLTLLHETPSPSSIWTARQPHARGWLG